MAVAPQHGDDPDTLLQHADVAMYAAKRALGGSAVYDPQLDDNAAERLALLADLRRAIDEDELLLQYQPIIDAHSGRVARLEALVRWRHPTRGVVPPAGFIDIAERSGLIRELSLWVLETGLKQLRAWNEIGVDVHLSLNLSMRNLLDSDLPEALASIIAREGIDARRIGLEITEGALMADQPRIARTVGRLRELGVAVAIDDFGRGYTSLAYLSELRVDEVKIDRSFVSALRIDSSAAAIVRATVELAHALGARVVAEGVEDDATMRWLVSGGVDELQGYLFARPMDPADVTRWLASRLITQAAVA